MTRTYIRCTWFALVANLLVSIVGCTRSIELSVGQAKQHVSMLVDVTSRDVEELRNGMPKGAEQLGQAFRGKAEPKDDLDNVRVQLDRARNHVQDLRVAKSTFFAFVDKDGTVLRSDREPDLMSGKNLFAAFPATRQSLEGKIVTTLGEMAEAAGVKGRRDGQFVHSVPISVEGAMNAVYASGWSWSAYAYRLQNALMSELRGRKEPKEPLVYVYLVVGDSVFGAQIAPMVNADAIKKLGPLAKAVGDAIFATPLEVTGREFGLAVRRAPSLGQDVAVAVLRSET
jgi:hypothetical protein